MYNGTKQPVGCSLGTAVVNHLIYADDLLLFAHSAKGLQTLPEICYTDVSTTFNIMLVNPWSCTVIKISYLLHISVIFTCVLYG